jgi:hypothetical protein
VHGRFRLRFRLGGAAALGLLLDAGQLVDLGLQPGGGAARLPELRLAADLVDLGLQRLWVELELGLLALVPLLLHLSRQLLLLVLSVLSHRVPAQLVFLPHGGWPGGVSGAASPSRSASQNRAVWDASRECSPPSGIVRLMRP